MKLILVILALIVVAFAFLSMRKRGAAAASRRSVEANTNLADTAKFHAVSLKVGTNACDEARKLEGKRYLANSAPRTPLPGCDAADCRCRFMHHADRREGDDRRTPYPSPTGLETGVYEKDQRQRGDRRRNRPNPF